MPEDSESLEMKRIRAAAASHDHVCRVLAAIRTELFDGPASDLDVVERVAKLTASARRVVKFWREGGFHSPSKQERFAALGDLEAAVQRVANPSRKGT